MLQLTNVMGQTGQGWAVISLVRELASNKQTFLRSCGFVEGSAEWTAAASAVDDMVTGAGVVLTEHDKLPSAGGGRPGYPTLTTPPAQ